MKEFLRSFREIRLRPRAYPFVVGYERRQLRRKVHRNDLIFYRGTEDRIEIVHVIHGTMDYETILGERK